MAPDQAAGGLAAPDPQALALIGRYYLDRMGLGGARSGALGNDRS